MEALAPGEDGADRGMPAVDGIDGEDPGIAPGMDGEAPGLPPGMAGEAPARPLGMDDPADAPLEPERDELDELEELDELDELEEELELLFDLHPANSTIVAANTQQWTKPLDLVMIFSLFGVFFGFNRITIAIA